VSKIYFVILKKKSILGQGSRFAGQRIHVMGIVAALLIALATGAVRPLRLGYFLEPQPFQVLCENADIECISQPSGLLAASALCSGLLDASVLGSVPWATAVSRGVEMTTDYVVHVKHTGSGLMIRGPGPSTPLDLANHRVGVAFGSTAHAATVFLAELFSIRNVTVVFMDSARVLEAWDAGEIDAAYCWGTAYRELLRRTHLGESTLVADAYMLSLWGFKTFNVLAIRRGFAEEEPERVYDLVRRWSATDAPWAFAFSQGYDRWASSETSAKAMLPAPHEWRAVEPAGNLASVARMNRMNGSDLKARHRIALDIGDFEFVPAHMQLSCDYLDPNANCSTQGASRAFEQTRAFLYKYKVLDGSAGKEEMPPPQVNDPTVLAVVVRNECARCLADEEARGCEAWLWSDNCKVRADSVCPFRNDSLGSRPGHHAAQPALGQRVIFGFGSR